MFLSSPPPINRRRLLGAVTGAMTTTIAGCIGDDEEYSPDPLAAPASLAIKNNSGDSVDVSVEVEKEGTSVFSEFYSLVGAERRELEDRDDEGYLWSDQRGVSGAEWLGELTDYTVTAEIPGTDHSSTFSTAETVEELGDYDATGRCYWFRVYVGPSDIPDPATEANDITVTYRSLTDNQDIPEGVECERDG